MRDSSNGPGFLQNRPLSAADTSTTRTGPRPAPDWSSGLVTRLVFYNTPALTGHLGQKTRGPVACILHWVTPKLGFLRDSAEIPAKERDSYNDRGAGGRDSTAGFRGIPAAGGGGESQESQRNPALRSSLIRCTTITCGGRDSADVRHH